MTGVIDNSLIDTSVFADSVSAFLPNTAYVAFSQDGMRPLAACVSPGDQVSEGDVIARSSGPTVTAVHTPIPGRVESFTTCLAPNGKKTLAAKIRLSGVFSYLGKPAQKEDLGGVKRSKLQVILAERGVLNTFLRPVALSSQIAALPPRRRCIIAVRLFDNDPSQRTDSFIAERYAPEVAEGAAILAGALNAGGVAFLFDKKTSPRSRRIYTAFDYPCAGAFCSADARKYPAGTMGEILKTVRESGGGPAFASISYQDLFVDPLTLLNVYRALALNTPVMETFVHVSGSAVKRQGMFSVRVGTLIQNLIEECGGFLRPPDRVVVNGKARGMSINIVDVPVTKYVKSIRFLQNREIPGQRTSECIRCGRCRFFCPSGLEPDVLFAHAGGIKAAPGDAVLSSLLCTDCSLCDVSCPARLPLSQSISFLKETCRL